MFSQPPPIAIGESNMFPGKTRNIDEDTGKPITAPWNMKIGHFYKGKVEGRGGNNRSSYFGKAAYIAASS